MERPEGGENRASSDSDKEKNKRSGLKSERSETPKVEKPIPSI